MTSPARAPRPTPRRSVAPAPEIDRRAHLRVVPPPSRPRSRRGRRTGPVVVVAMVLVFGSLMASAMLHGLLVGGQAHLDRLDSQIESEQGDLQREKLELADLQSPARIADEARKLGMVPADRQHWVSPVAGAEPIVTGGEAVDPADPSTDTTSTDPTSTDQTELATADGGAAAQ